MKTKIILYLSLFVAAVFNAQTNSENYIQSTTCLDSTCIRKVETIQYFDYLGRPKQVIGIKATPSGKTWSLPSCMMSTEDRPETTFLFRKLRQRMGRFIPKLQD